MSLLGYGPEFRNMLKCVLSMLPISNADTRVLSVPKTCLLPDCLKCQFSNESINAPRYLNTTLPSLTATIAGETLLHCDETNERGK